MPISCFKKYDGHVKVRLKSQGNKISTQTVFSFVPKYLALQPFSY